MRARTSYTGCFAVVLLGVVVLSTGVGGCSAPSEHPWENRIARTDLPQSGPGPCWTITYDRLQLRPACKGPVKAEFAITRHFDVRRSYEFGESTQPLSLSEERPWQERSFIEVDWSRNLLGRGGLAASPGTLWAGVLGLLGIGAGIAWSHRHR
jgi:hypothetical protein